MCQVSRGEDMGDGSGVSSRHSSAFCQMQFDEASMARTKFAERMKSLTTPAPPVQRLPTPAASVDNSNLAIRNGSLTNLLDVAIDVVSEIDHIIGCNVLNGCLRRKSIL